MAESMPAHRQGEHQCREKPSDVRVDGLRLKRITEIAHSKFFPPFDSSERYGEGPRGGNGERRLTKVAYPVRSVSNRLANSHSLLECSVLINLPF
jgi:hypothetical protein